MKGKKMKKTAKASFSLKENVVELYIGKQVGIYFNDSVMKRFYIIILII